MFKRMKGNGIRISSLMIIMIIFILVSCGCMLYYNIILDAKYEAVLESDELYKSCQYKTKLMTESTSNLAMQIQYFVRTQEINYMTAYATEYNSGKRERAIEGLSASSDEKYLIKAKQNSDFLVEKDIHIMKLIVRAKNIEKRYVPLMVQEYVLPEDELYMSSSDKLKLAENMLYSNAYMNLRKRINSDTNEYSNRVLNHENSLLQYNEADMRNHIRIQQLLCIIVIVILLVFCLVFYEMVIKVLRNYVKFIINNQSLTPMGVFEMRYLATAYNANVTKTKKKEKQLEKQARYDALTGVLNRGAMEHYIIEKLEEEEWNGAFIIIDVDKFKLINDNYGHEMGDKILKLVAYTLVQSFRNDDVVGRLGGDEFAIWLSNLPEEHLHYITERFETINKQLTSPNTSFPAISLSVGITLCQEGDDFKAVYNRADKALYYVKEHGRCGFRIYSEE